MKLEKLELGGFKQFAEKGVSFESGINVIRGKNEAGKSTILEAIISAITGLPPAKREDVKSWHIDDRLSVSLTYITDSGDTYKIKRDFLGDSSVLFMREKGRFKEVTSVPRIIGQKLMEHFGIIDEKLLRSTIVMRQKEIGAVESEKGRIKKSLSTLIAGATVNPVSTAIEKLKSGRKELKYYRGEGGELYKLKSELEQAKKTLEQANKDESDAKKAEGELNEKKEKLERKESTWGALDSLLRKYDAKAELEEEEHGIRNQMETLEEAKPEVSKKDPTLLYVGSTVIIASLILAGLFSPWLVSGVLFGFIFVYLYYKQEVKFQLPKGLRERSEKLAQDLAAVRSGLKEYTHITLDPEEVEKKRSEWGGLKNEIGELREDVTRLDSKIKTIRERGYDIAATRADKESLEGRIRELGDKVEAFDLAADVLKKAESEAYGRVSPTLSGKASGGIKKITNGRYSTVEITPDLDVMAKIPETGEVKEIESLSDGTQEQIYFVSRLAMSEVLSGGRKLPLLLDESFVFFDEDRFENSMKLLKDLSKEYQIIIFSLYNAYDRFADNLIHL